MHEPPHIAGAFSQELTAAHDNQPKMIDGSFSRDISTSCITSMTYMSAHLWARIICS